MEFLVFAHVHPAVGVVRVGADAVLRRPFEVELRDGTFFHSRYGAGETGVEDVYSAEGQVGEVVGRPCREDFPGLHVPPSAELAAVAIETEIALRLAVPDGERGLGIA